MVINQIQRREYRISKNNIINKSEPANGKIWLDAQGQWLPTSLNLKMERYGSIPSERR
jgi:hypothetical protein